MYNIKIQEIEENKLTADVTFIHPDAGEKISSKDFALQVICYTSVDSNWKNLPISKEEWKTSIDNHPKKGQLLELNEFLFGKTFFITEDEYSMLSNDDSKRNLERTYNCRFESWGTENGKHYIQTKMNVADFTDEAASIIADQPEVVALNPKSYRLKFSVNDKDLLAHLKVGMDYETAAFSIEDYYF